jgi:hypothetical protein
MNYDSLTELRIPKITVTTEHVKSFAISSPVDVWWWIRTMSSIHVLTGWRLSDN